MKIEWKPKFLIKKMVAKMAVKEKTSAVSKQKMVIAEKVNNLKKLKMVKIEIRNVACPLVKKYDTKLKEVLVKKNLSLIKIDKLIKYPWIFEIFKWKTIATTVDDGSHFWKVPSTYKKGCYQIRVTRLWCDSNDKDRSDISETFTIIKIPIGIFSETEMENISNIRY